MGRIIKMAKKRVRALNADGDITWCSAEVMGAKGCNHLAHGTEDEVEAAQIEFFLNEGGLIGNAVSNNYKNSDANKKETDDLLSASSILLLQEKEKLEALLVKKGFTEKHLQLLANPDSVQIFMDADYERWFKTELMITFEKSQLSEAEKKILEKKLSFENEDIRQYFYENTSNVDLMESVDLSSPNARKYIRALISNEHTPPHILNAISNDASLFDSDGKMWGHYALKFSNNPHTPSEAIVRTVKNNHQSESYNYLQQCQIKSFIHLNMPDEEIEKILGQENEFYYIKEALIKSPNTSPEIMERLYDDAKTYNDCHEFVKNPNVPATVLEKMFKDKAISRSLNYSMISHPNFPQNLLEDIGRNINGKYEEHLVRKAAINPHMPPQILSSLVGRNLELSRYVAINPNLPKEDLVKLSTSSSPHIRMGIAKNTNTPQTILMQLANDSHSTVRLQVLDNTAAPTEAVEKAFFKSTDDLCAVYDLAAIHENSSEKMLESIIDNGREIIANQYRSSSKRAIDITYKRMIAKIAVRADASPDLLKKIAKLPDRSSEQELRRALLKNDNFPTEAVMQLSKLKSLEKAARGRLYLRALG